MPIDGKYEIYKVTGHIKYLPKLAFKKVTKWLSRDTIPVA